VKKLISLLSAMLLVSASASAGVITCDGCTVNGSSVWQTGEETVLTAVSDYAADDAVIWKLNGDTVPSDKDGVLVFKTSGDMTVTCEKRQELIVTAVGASLKALDKNGKAEGDGYEEMDFTAVGTAGFAVVAESNKSKKVDYWVIDGYKYDFFEYRVTKIIVTGLERSMTVEAVYEGSKPVTLRSGQENEPDGPLVVTVKGGQACFITAKGTGKGGWYSSVDFTNDYENLATGQTQPGGLIDLRIRTGSTKKNYSWLIDGVKFSFDSPVITFRVYGLDRSITYEPAGK